MSLYMNNLSLIGNFADKLKVKPVFIHLIESVLE